MLSAECIYSFVAGNLEIPTISTTNWLVEKQGWPRFSLLNCTPTIKMLHKRFLFIYACCFFVIWSTLIMDWGVSISHSITSHTSRCPVSLLVITLIDLPRCIRVMGYQPGTPITMQIKVSWAGWCESCLMFYSFLLVLRRKKNGGENRHIQLLAQTALIVSFPCRVFKKNHWEKEDSVYFKHNACLTTHYNSKGFAI